MRRWLRPYLFLVLAGTAPILALATLAYLLAAREIERLVHADNDATAMTTAAFVERELEQWTFTVQSYAEFPTLNEAIRERNVLEARRRLEIIVTEHPRLDRAFVTDTTGLLWADFPEAPESLNRRFDDRDWYRGVRMEGGPYVSELYQRHAAPPLFVVAIAVAVRDPVTREPIGFLVAHVLPDGISELLRQVAQDAPGTVLLLDHTGAVVAHPTLDLQSNGHAAYRAVLPTFAGTAVGALRGRYEDPLSQEAVIASWVEVPVGLRPWTVVAHQPVSVAGAPARALGLQLAGAGILLALLVGGLTTGLARENARRGRAEQALAAINRDLERRVEERTAALRMTEEELYHSRKIEAVGRLAGGIAHDFNNLLTVIISSAGMLRDVLPEGSPGRQDVEDLHAAGERAAELTRQLLAFSRKQVMRPEILDVNEAVERMKGILERVIGSDLALVFRLGRDLHPVRFDPGQIGQVVLNLAVNARDAMPAGGTLTIKTANVELVSEHVREDHESQSGESQSGPHVMLSVSDTGEGMDAETRERIFEPFFTTKELGRGTGLGLSTVYGIVKQGGGHIWVQSEPGRGTTFKVYFPRAEPGTEADT